MVLLEAGIPPPKVRVFIADDIDVIMKTLAAILDLAGYDACAVYNGASAHRVLEILRPEMVVTDITVPSVTALHLRSVSAALSLSRCKVLLFTGHSDLNSLLVDRDGASPSVDLLTRPIRSEDLRSKLYNKICSEHPPLLVPIDLSEAILQ